MGGERGLGSGDTVPPRPPGGESRGKNMQIWRRAMWVAIKLRIRLYHRSILLVSGSPSQCMEFHCGDNKMVKRKENYIYKKRNNICVIGHFSGCHFVFPF